jgi:predicted RNA-binding Zn-ribbon protein involved in translation (DUF1610 family)
MDEEREVNFEFDCPDCGTHILGYLTKCPKCGVEFVFEEVEETKCPRCGKNVAIDAQTCPACGKRFESELPPHATPPPFVESVSEVVKETPEQLELKRQFPILVAEVKPLMELAKEYDIETGECRSLIDRAVKAGKAGDRAAAVQYVKECNVLVRQSIEDRIGHDIEYLEKLSVIARGMNTDPAEINESVERTKQFLAIGDYAGALKEARAGRKISEKVTGKYLEASDMCDSLDGLIQNAERFYIDTRESKRLLKEAQEAGEHGDWTMMGILARKGRECLQDQLPEVVNKELKKAKSQLINAKANGKDVTTPVKVLKDAGLAVKREQYDEALEYLIEFKSELRRL